MKRKIIITIIIAVAIAALGVLGVQFVRLSQENEKQQEDLKAAEELLDMEKRQAQEDLLSMQAEINEFSAMNIGNDSLIAQIEEQKQKIQLLIDELNTVKATDAKKIQELKDELSVVRTVLYDYIRKVDSLNRVNSALRNENSQMKQQVEETTTKNEQLTKDKQQLTEVVTRAAMIDVDILSVETLNKRGNVTNRLGKIQRIAVNILIGKNVTTQVGYKTIYMRILSPSHECLNKGNTKFKYEGNYIAYSMKKDIEYKGEKQQQILYYDVTETLMPGTYKVDVFIDGAALASTTFNITKK
ncbi:MAG: hypothetical protein J6K01_03530 [Paludibacteraceae bacterium]|jgi:hypothetical protein|nr:hypothetical protein [Bacteroidales bacterium]MBP3466666.1 hypothetical protein [Paludibacteraceae bacterium]MBQ2591634.1 hypothetical protein [Paludibacteraceae bacterium]MBR0497933.1 hypothetical protein [Paludibacteraceae bacterium]MCM8872598.1 hypothetical protein [Paludibacteraceae bacterium]